MSSRDNFSPSVKRMMRDRVAGRCSNPVCRVPTLAPSGKEKLNSTGIAAHIHAAAAGGARYDPNMSKDERKSIHNGLWLCSNCSIKIDKDENAYPSTLLHLWKNTAEENALNELGQRLPDKNDAIDTLTVAMTGMNRGYLSQAIDNVHKAHDQSLENLDPRFTVTTDYINERSITKINPKEDVPIKIHIMPEAKSDFINKHNNLVRHGQDLTISSDVFQIKGSKLIEHITDFSINKGSLTISSKKMPAIQKVWIVNEKNGVHTYLDDIHGDLALGIESYSFKGFALNQILKLESTFYIGKNIAQTKLKLDFSVWEDKPLNKLSFFKKIFNFYEAISKGGTIYAALEVDGEQQVVGVVQSTNDVNFSNQVFSHLRYIEYVRVISNYMNNEIRFKPDTVYDYDHFQLVEEIYRTIKGEKKWTAEQQTKNGASEVHINSVDDYQKLIDNYEEVEGEIKIQEIVNEKVELFGVEITLPSKVVHMQGVHIKVVQGTVDDVKNGRAIKVEYVPTENYLCSIVYDPIQE